METDSQNLQGNVADGGATATESPQPVATEGTAAAPAFGWNTYAEKMNGRFAMIGFVALLILEFFTRQDFFTWLGF